MPTRNPEVLARSRLVIYVLGFALAAGLDPSTPVGIADWLIEVILVWMASVLGGRREMYMVCAASSIVLALGLWTSPHGSSPFWMDAVNRLGAMIITWAMVHVGARRRAAEQTAAHALHEVKTLRGLLPMCAGCKAIRNPAGEWLPLESYLTSHSEARLTHSLCPPCAKKYMGE